MAASRFAFSIDEPRRARLKNYAAARGVSAASILKAIIDRLPTELSRGDRSAKQEMQPPTNKITVRLRDNERQALDEHVATTGFDSRTSWATRILIQAINNSPAMSRDEINELRRSRSELAAHGRNLNQIAKAMNANGNASGPDVATIDGLLRAVEDHKNAVADLIDTVKLRSQQ